jgi:hypothetical protein
VTGAERGDHQAVDLATDGAEDPPEHGESVVLVQWALVLVDDLGWQGEAGHPARLHAPAQERVGRATGGQLLGVPGVEVNLLAVFDGATSAGELSEEDADLGDLLVGLGPGLLPLSPRAK